MTQEREFSAWADSWESGHFVEREALFAVLAGVLNRLDAIEHHLNTAIGKGEEPMGDWPSLQALHEPTCLCAECKPPVIWPIIG